MHTCTVSIKATSVSVSLHELCLVDSDNSALPMSSAALLLTIPPLTLL